MVVDGYSPLVLKTVAVPLYLRMAPFVFEMCLRAENRDLFSLARSQAVNVTVIVVL